MTDPERLAAQYGTENPLRVRIETHRQYTVGPGLEPAVDTALALSGDETLLDVGTGPGDFLCRLRAAGHRGRLVGVDLSPGMIERARAAVSDVDFLIADAAALPFLDAAFDIVTARHMLYHVPDIPAALSEMRRVLKPGGRFLAVTNAVGYMEEFWQIVREATSDEPELHTIAAEIVSSRFDDISGAVFVRDAFGDVTVSYLDAALSFPAPEPVVAYFDTIETMRSLSPDTWARCREAFRRHLQTRFADGGPFRVSKRVTLLTASPSVTDPG
jgi:SAM-dependent methyltransferase